MAGVERRPDLRLIQDGATAQTAQVIRIYIHQFSSDGAQSSKGYLQITDLDLLRGKDCKRMCRSLQVEQFLGLSEGGRVTEREPNYCQAG